MTVASPQPAIRPPSSGGRNQGKHHGSQDILEEHLGILAATKPDSWIDQLTRVIVTAGVSLPTFFTGLRAEMALSYLFISHDLEGVRLLCDRIIVMHAGKIVEEGATAQILERPAADYTRQLIAAIPPVDRPETRAATRYAGSY